MKEPKDIYQNLLDTATAALLSGDADGFLSLIKLPHTMSVSGGKAVLTTSEEARAAWVDFTEAIKCNEIVDIARHCTSASYLSPLMIVGFHTVQMVKKDGMTMPDYTTKWVLDQVDGRWLLSKSVTVISELEWPNLPHAHIAQFQSDKSAKANSPEEIRRCNVQALTDCIDILFVTGDFEGWFKTVSLPFERSGRAGRKVFTSEDTLRADFMRDQEDLRRFQVTDLVRTVNSVDQPSDDMLLARCTVHLLRETTHVIPAWNMTMQLRIVEGRWRVAGIDNSVSPLSHHGLIAANAAPEH